jgi:hypothetical protein
LGALVGVGEKKIDTHEYRSPQIKNRGSDLRLVLELLLAPLPLLMYMWSMVEGLFL